MKIYIKNATIISMSKNREKIEEDIDIEIENNKIKTIGKNIKVEENSKIIDATGKVVMPGLINTHSHVPMSIFRETVDGYALQDWLTKKIWPMEDKLTKEDIYYASMLSFIEMIKTGCTTINDMYSMTEEIIKAALDCKIRIQTTRTLMDMNNEDEGKKRFEELEKVLNEYSKKEELITFNVGIHGLYTSSKEYVEKCIEFAKKNELLLHMHFCENTKEVEDIKELYKEEPIKIIEQEFKDIKTILAHCVKLNKQDIEKLSKLDISVSHCPISNLKLGCGIADISEMIKKGINVSLGTDGQGSGSNLDLFETMKFTALLQKGQKEDATEIPAYEVLKMATINGAKTLGLENKIGSIEEGKDADLIILNLEDAVTSPINDLCSDIVYNAKGINVITTIVNGNILMENRKIKINEKEIYDECAKIIETIK
ncbi:MAG: amidohydrolase [Clostridiaceae bacterium]|nr:amidohydrolase [Clostridiaceae bacterium]